MSAAASPSRFREAVTCHWRYFVLAWAVPVVLYAGGAAGLLNQATFSFVVLPLFFAGQVMAYLPYRRRRIGYWPLVFCGMLLPLLIWAALVFGVGLLAETVAGA